MNPKVLEISSRNLKTEPPTINIGDMVKVTVRIVEGGKERSQNYEGVIIKIKGSGVSKTFTVRRVFQNIGVERVFFLHSKKVEGVKVLRSGKTRRAKLYYLRNRTGKSAKLKEVLNSPRKENNNKEQSQESTLVQATT